VSTGIQLGYLAGSPLVNVIVIGTPLCATTAMPNEPA
jgi:hypothetical protein